MTHMTTKCVMSNMLTIEKWIYNREYVICRHIILHDISTISVLFDKFWRSIIKKNTHRFCVVRSQECVLYRHPQVNWSWCFYNYGGDDFASELVARCESYFIQFDKWLSSFVDDNRINSSPPWTKWPPFRRRHRQMHFREWKLVYFESNVIVLCS